MVEDEKRICFIPRWISPMELTYGPNYWYLWKLKNRRTKKTCIVIRMKQDVDPLFHIKQSKSMCFVSKKIDSTEKRILFNPKYIF